MHSGNETHNVIGMHSVTAMQSATGKPGPDRVQQASIKPQTVMDERPAFETKYPVWNI